MKVTVALFALAAAAAGWAVAAPRDRTYDDIRRGIRIEAPPGWEVTTQSGYPSILAVLIHPGGARISIAAAHTDAPDLNALVAAHRKGLEAQGLRVLRIEPDVRGAIDVLMLAPERSEAVRQAYMLWPDASGQQAVIVTLTCGKADLGGRGTDFAFVLRRLVVSRPPASLPDAGRADSARG